MTECHWITKPDRKRQEDAASE